MRIILSITWLLLFGLHAAAQEICGFEQSHQRLMQSDANYRAVVEKTKLDWAKYAEATAKQKLLITGNDTVFEIPVVIHVVHTGGAVGTQFNPSDQQLIDLIDFTNKCYEASWPAYPSPLTGGAYIPFKFTLAKRDPNCAPTNGIVRVDGSGLPDYATNGIQIGSGLGAVETQVKALSRWPNDQYYNIWVVNHIGGPSGGVAGYAYYPGAGPAVDGTVILASVAQVGSTTLVHEIGHGLGLPHTFEGDNGGTSCPVNTNCNTDGDGICDTEPHMRGATCTEVTNPCTNAPFTFTRNSFMSYSHGCRDRFTHGQGQKMKFNLMTNRTALMLSEGAQPPPAQATAACIPTSTNPNSTQNYGPQTVSFHTIARSSGGYNSEGVHVDDFCNGRTEVYTGSSYGISVKTGPNMEDVKVFIDYDNDGVFSFSETVFSSNGTSSNQTHSGTITIPTSGITLCQPLRMRVVSDIASNPFLLACGPLEYGQAEDYVITAKPPSTATMSAVSMGSYPFCKDSAVTFTVNTTNVPPNVVISWLVNGVPVATGLTFTTTTLQPGDLVRARVLVNNVACSTPDTVLSNAITAAFLPGPPAPVISFINGSLVSNISPVYWFGPNGLIPGVTGATYHPTQPGNYYAIAVGNPCPSDSSNILNVGLLDIPQTTKSSFEVYPIPATDELNIVVNGNEFSATIFDAMGRELQSRTQQGSQLRISVRDLPNGIYLLSVTNELGRRAVKRFQILR